MADRSVAGTGGGNNRSVAGTGAQPVNNTPSSYPSGGGGGGGYGGRSYSKGGGGGGSGSKDQQKKTQAQINNTAGNYATRKKDLDKLGQQQLNNINQQIKANNALLKQQNKQIQQNIQWQPNQQREQSTLMNMRNRMGNTAYGSGVRDLMEGMGRVDDMNDVELIQTYKQNSDNAYNNWFQANESLVSDYNDQVTSIQDEYSKLFSQYWSTLSNINPQLATKTNLLKSSKQVSNVAKAQANVDKAKQALAKANKDLKKVPKKNTALVTATLGGKTLSTLTNKAAQAKVDAAKKALANANKKLAAAKKPAVSVGKGTDKYTLPNITLDPSSSLSKMLKAKSSASAKNPATAAYIRPAKARTRLGGDSGANGNFNRADDANSGFYDNLRGFPRV